MKKAILLSAVLTLGLIGGNYVSADSLSSYTIQDNETFWTISQKLNINVNQLMASNPTVDPNYLYSGLVIKLPFTSATAANFVSNQTGTMTSSNGTTATTTSVPSTTTNTTTKTTGTTTSANTYTIQAGDNFWIISQKLNIDWNSLVAANPNVNVSNLYVGQVITLPAKNGVTTTSPSSTNTSTAVTSTTNSAATAVNSVSNSNGTAATTKNIPSTTTNTSSKTTGTTTSAHTYTIQAGDNFWIISQKLNIDWNSLVAANPYVNANNLYIGEVITLPAKNMATTTAPSTTNTSTVTTSMTTSAATPVNSVSNQTGITHTSSNGTTTTAPVTQPVTANNSMVKPAWQVKADAIIATGMDYLGTPYVFGGGDPTTGFDCSGFTQFVFGKNGISLPHSAAMQSQMGTPVTKDLLREGDLVFLQGTYTPGVSHVGIYMGNNQVLQAGTMNNVRAVKVSTFFGTPYYDAHYCGAQRIIN
jgi:cell wall-associated NlpC family hydrolase